MIAWENPLSTKIFAIKMNIVIISIKAKSCGVSNLARIMVITKLKNPLPADPKAVHKKPNKDLLFKPIKPTRFLMRKHHFEGI